MHNTLTHASYIVINVLLPGNQPPNLNSIPIGASIELRFNYTLIDSTLNNYVLMPIYHTPLQVPEVAYEPEPNWVRVTYNRASPSLTGEYVLCRINVNLPDPDSETRKRDVGRPGPDSELSKREVGGPGPGVTDNNDPLSECGERVVLNVYGRCDIM